jgi:hypothetical protein
MDPAPRACLAAPLRGVVVCAVVDATTIADGQLLPAMTGAINWAVTVASPGEGGTGMSRQAASSQAGRPASPRVRAVSDLGEISPVWVSEGVLERPSW